jgi:hypothetical protein
MPEPVYFVVERWGGSRTASLVTDRLPQKFQGRAAKRNGLHYSRRIDDQPHLASRSLADLVGIYELFGGELPDKPASKCG